MNFSRNFSTGMSYLRRRFSSSDLQEDIQNEEEEQQRHSRTSWTTQPKKHGPSPSAPTSPSRNHPPSTFGSVTQKLYNAAASAANRAATAATTAAQSYNKVLC